MRAAGVATTMDSAFVHTVAFLGSRPSPVPNLRPLCKRRPVMTLAAPASTLFVPLPSAAAPSVDVEPVTPISGSDEFLAACQRSVDCLVVVQVKAPWCRSCKALEAKVRRLAREYADEVVFFSMNYEDPENKPIAYRLGVKNMPTFMFFQGEFGQVEQFTCGPNRAAIIREKIDIYVAGECPYEPAENAG